MKRLRCYLVVEREAPNSDEQWPGRWAVYGTDPLDAIRSNCDVFRDESNPEESVTETIDRVVAEIRSGVLDIYWSDEPIYKWSGFDDLESK